MIYEEVDANQPIKQGDIFFPLPFLSLDPEKLVVVNRDGQKEQKDWLEASKNAISIIQAPIKLTWGIVASQDCDASRAPIISFFAIDTFANVTNLTLPTSTRSWVSTITQKSRLNARWFYLPSDDRIDFVERMAINFHLVFQISRDYLEKNINLRKGRLNEISYQHYRESIAQYFRRYPYDEWYPLTKEEFQFYNQNNGPVRPFRWQE